jgi:WD40 repeat protein
VTSPWEVAFTPDGRQLAVASNAGVALHDTATDEVVGTLDTETGPSRSLPVSPDGRLLVTGGADGSVHVFDLKNVFEKIN